MYALYIWHLCGVVRCLVVVLQVQCFTATFSTSLCTDRANIYDADLAINEAITFKNQYGMPSIPCAVDCERTSVLYACRVIRLVISCKA